MVVNTDTATKLDDVPSGSHWFVVAWRILPSDKEDDVAQTCAPVSTARM